MTELRLLVIDLTDSCVVKVESLEKEFWLNMGGGYGDDSFQFTSEGSVQHMDYPFPVVRAAIDRLGGDAEAPPNSLIHNIGGQEEFPYRILGNDLSGSYLTEEDYEAFCNIAGHQIPIWEPKQGGEWVEVVRSGTYTPSTNETISVSIWRYTLGVKDD